MYKLLSTLPGYSKVEGLVKTATFKQSAITFIGTGLNGALGAVFYILTARFLGPAGFGLISVAIATMTLVSDIADLGTDTGLVNFIPRYWKSNINKAKRFMKLGLEIKVLVSGIVIAAGLVTSGWIAQAVFSKGELRGPLGIAFVGVGGLLLFSFIVHILQSLQRFWAWSMVQVGTNLLRVIVVIFAFMTGALTLTNSMWIYITMPLIGFIAGLLIIKADFIKVKNEWSVKGEFFRYNKWVAAFTVLAALSSRIDTFITARLLTANELGIYSAANQMVRIVPMAVTALGTVIAPKMAEMGSLKEMVKYLKKTQLMVIGIAGLGIFMIPVVLWLIPPIFGVEYISSGPVFIVLLFAMLTFLVSVPVHMSIFYYFSHPKLFFWLSLTHLIIVSAFAFLLIPQMGVMGSAVAVLIGHAVNFLIPLVWVLKRIGG